MVKNLGVVRGIALGIDKVSYKRYMGTMRNDINGLGNISGMTISLSGNRIRIRFSSSTIALKRVGRAVSSRNCSMRW